ncbi:hypothetical protein B0H10DRAFT_2216830 [Mycena sp. CBHHK59/15]|nr:hypothetical protein B0H10DRAFT_2216830 [Mycena sp. CBHHK59/15]
MEMPRPGLKTREVNKKTHPAVNAGVASEKKKTRRTPAQMQQAHADEVTAKARAKLDREKAKRCLASLEDKQQQDNITYAKNTNHPPDLHKKLSALASKAVEDAVDGRGGEDLGPKTAERPMGGGAGDNGDSGDESDKYEPTSGEESSEESDPEPEDSDEDELSKKKKRSPTSPTPTSSLLATLAMCPERQRTAGKPQKKPKVANKKSGLVKSKTGAPPSADDDSMVAPGGPTLNDDTGEHVERPKSGKKKKGIPAASLIAIQPAPPRAPTRKELRGGSAKWTLKHLPTSTSSQFTDEVVPLACKLVGSQQVKPWAKLTLTQIQAIVDRVFGEGVHEVTPEGPWVGLLGYRLNDWRHGIGAQPHKAMIDFIDLYETSDKEDVEDTNDDNHGNLNAGDAVSTAVDTSATTTDADAPADAAAKPPKFKFDTREGITSFAQWCLQTHDVSGTMAFHWKTWGNGVNKKGFLQSYLILHAFAYHLACLEEIPGRYEWLKSHPESALLMSAQAVELELQFWRTGDVQKWDDAHWEEVIEAAKEFMEVSSHKRAQTASRSSSEAGDDMILSDDDVVMVLSN